MYLVDETAMAVQPALHETSVVVLDSVSGPPSCRMLDTIQGLLLTL